MNEGTQTRTSPANASFWLVLTTIFWGGSFVFNKIGFRDIPPVTFLFFRFSLATLLMGLFCLRRLPRLNCDIMRKGMLVGLALGATNLSFVLGVSGTTVSRAGFHNNLFVLLVPLLSFLFWRERVDRWTLGAIVVAFAGIVELAQGGAEGFSRGDVLSTVCAFFIAVHIIAVSRLLREEDVYLVSLVQFATVAALGGLITLFFPSEPFRIGPLSAGALLYCAVFPTVVCFTLQNTYQRFTTPTRAGLIYTLDPVWSMLGGFLFLGERLSGREWVGCGLILGAVAAPLLVKLAVEQRLRITYGSNGERG